MSILDSLGFAKGELAANPVPTVERGIAHRLEILDIGERMLAYFPDGAEHEANPPTVAVMPVAETQPQVPEVLVADADIIPIESDEATNKALAIARAKALVDSYSVSGVTSQTPSNIVPLASLPSQLPVQFNENKIAA